MPVQTQTFNFDQNGNPVDASGNILPNTAQMNNPYIQYGQWQQQQQQAQQQAAMMQQQQAANAWAQNPVGAVGNMLAGSGQGFGVGGSYRGPMIPAAGAGGGGGAFGGLPPGIAGALANQYSNSYNQAKQANLQRYGQLVGGAVGAPGQTTGDLYNQQTGQLNSFSQLHSPASFTPQYNAGASAQIGAGHGGGGSPGGYGGQVGLLTDLYQRGMNDFANYSTAKNSQINQDYTSLAQQQRMNLANAGLSNSTVMNNALYGANNQRVQQQGLLAQQQISLDQSLTGNIANTIANRVDPYPSANTYLSTMAQLGKAGAFGGGGGSTSLSGPPIPTAAGHVVLGAGSWGSGAMMGTPTGQYPGYMPHA